MVYGMNMAYTTNPHIEKVRAKAVSLVRQNGWSTRKVATHIGVAHSTVVRWCQKVPTTAGSVSVIPTASSRPKTSPNKIDADIEKRIVEIRLERGRCAEVIHAQLAREQLIVSLSTVKRVLDRYGLRKKKSPWKKYHFSGERPIVENPGNLVEMDSIHIMKQRGLYDRIYIVTLIDVYSRWTYAKAFERISTHAAVQTAYTAQTLSCFSFECIQTDNGPEFTKYFTTMIESKGMQHRHTRVRKPNDNAHIERFNRTIQEEMRTEIRQYKHNIPWLNRSINEYLKYYNTERLHMGLGYQTPQEILDEYS